MEDLERRVLRKKRFRLVKAIPPKELIAACLKCEIITEDIAAAVLGERSTERQVYRLIEQLHLADVADPFQTFCDVLQQLDGSLANELRSDLKAEQGSLTLDDDVKTETAVLVHRKFGTSRRLTVQDRDEMVNIIATKLQVSKERWKDELKSATDELEHVQSILQHYESNAAKLENTLKRYIKSHRKGLTTYAHDTKTPQEVLRESAPDDDLIGRLSVQLGFLMGSARRVLEDRQLLWDERDKCLGLLQSTDADMPTSTSELLRGKLDQLGEEISCLEIRVEEKKKEVKHHLHRVDSLEVMVEERDQRITDLETRLARLCDEQEEQKKRIEELEKEKLDLLEANAELKEITAITWSPQTNRKLRPSTSLDFSSRSPRSGSPRLGSPSSFKDLSQISSDSAPRSPKLSRGNRTPGSPSLGLKAFRPGSPSVRPASPVPTGFDFVSVKDKQGQPRSPKPARAAKSPSSPDLRLKNARCDSPRSNSPKPVTK